MDNNNDGPICLGFKLVLQDSLNFVYNFDIAKSRHLLFGGLCVGLSPVHGGCLFAWDTIRNCIEKEETKFTVGLITSPGKSKPGTSPPFFPVFNFLGAHGRSPGAEISVTASKRLDDKLNAGLALGLDARDPIDVSLAGFASYELDDETTASVYVNSHLSFGLGVTRQLNAYHSVSLVALVALGRGLSLGLVADYRPEPPLMLRIRYKIKEWKRDGIKVGGGGSSDPDLIALEEAAKKTFEDAKKTWNSFLNRSC